MNCKRCRKPFLYLPCVCCPRPVEPRCSTCCLKLHVLPAKGIRCLIHRDALVAEWMGLPARVYEDLSWMPGVRKLGYEDAVSHGYLSLIKAAEYWRDDVIPEGRASPVLFKSYAYRAIYNNMIQQVADEAWESRVPSKLIAVPKEYLENVNTIRNCTNAVELDGLPNDGEADMGKIKDGLMEVEPPAQQILLMQICYGLNQRQVAKQTGYSCREVRQYTDDGLVELVATLRE